MQEEFEKYGFNFKKADNENIIIKSYTSRIDTVFGITYVIIPTNHKKLENLITPDQKELVKNI